MSDEVEVGKSDQETLESDDAQNESVCVGVNAQVNACAPGCWKAVTGSKSGSCAPPEMCSNVLILNA